MKHSATSRHLGPWLAVFTWLVGCAHYAPLQLPGEAQLAHRVSALKGPPAFGLLTVDQVVALALANSPDLRALRAKRGIAQAQRSLAGIRPNPTLTGAFLPLISGPGTISAWNIGLSDNIRAILSYRSRNRAAGEAARQVDADIVWQEWQVAGEARQLAANLILSARSRPSYVSAYDILSTRNAKLEAALAGGNVTLATVAPDRVALQAARTALNALDQRQLSLNHRLDALLGLAPHVALPLATTVALPPFDPVAVRSEIQYLPERRPDFLALRMGYAQADEQVREAILLQFPDLVFGVGASSDNSRVVNGGPSVSVGLPVFDRNQGAIGVAKASRAQLRADYTARLTSAVGQVEATLAEMAQLSAQLTMIKQDLPAARLAAEEAAEAFGAANLDERSYVDLVVNRFTKEQDIMTLEQALSDRQIALQTLTGAGLPVASVDTPPGGTTP